MLAFLRKILRLLLAAQIEESSIAVSVRTRIRRLDLDRLRSCPCACHTVAASIWQGYPYLPSIMFAMSRNSMQSRIERMAERSRRKPLTDCRGLCYLTGGTTCQRPVSISRSIRPNHCASWLRTSEETCCHLDRTICLPGNRRAVCYVDWQTTLELLE